MNIPDPNFEQALIDLGIDSDGVINQSVLRSDVQNIEVLDVPSRNISSLEGLSAFTNLRFLRAWENQLASLDVSANTQLVHLSVANNQITQLDLTNNTAIVELYAYNNQLSSLQIPPNDQLIHLSISNNQLTNLDIASSSALVDAFINDNKLSSVNLGSHPELVNFHAGGNSINSLDVSDAPSLKSLIAWGSNLSVVDFSNNLLLEEVDLNDNNLSSLDLSSNPNLKFVYCGSNDLTYLNISNGNNSGFISPEWSEYSFVASGNPSLACIQVDAEMVEANRIDWGKDAGAIYSSDCANKPEYVAIPEFNFEQALIEFGIDTGIVNGWLLKSRTQNIIYLDIPGRNISSLRGIEAFRDLRELHAYDNKITTLDLSANTQLVNLSLNNNQLTEIDVSGITSLEQIHVNRNSISNLNLGNQPNLWGIYAGGNELNSIDLTGLPALQHLTIWENNLQQLDLQNNTELRELFADHNQLISLDVSSNTKLETIFVLNNALTSLNIANGNNANFVSPDWSEFSLVANGNPDLFCVQVDSEIVGTDRGDWGVDNQVIFSADCNSYTPELIWGVVGTATPNNWVGPDIPMEYNETTNSWSVTTQLSDGLIKFRLNNDWTTNLGDGAWENTIRDGILEQDGADIPVSAGNFYISFDLDTYEYKISSASVAIPDANFEQALIDLGIDSDGVVNTSILRSDAEIFSGMLDVSNKGISDLTGIEAFVNITELQAGDNEISSIDVSKNLKLEKIWVYSNLLTELDLTANTKIQRISAASNQLVRVDFSGLKDLQVVLLAQNEIKSLDLSNNTNLVRLALNSNPIESLDVRNGNNQNVYYFYMPNTPNLTCINADTNISQVMKDSGKNFSVDCDDFVEIPDPNFEQALIDIGVDSDGVVNQSILRSDAEAVIDLNLNNPLFDTSSFANQEIVNVTGKIADLTGIEAFVNLTGLQAGNGELTSVDLSQNTKLESLFLNDNKLSEIDISGLAWLKRFGIMRNPISGTVDVSNNLLLEELFVHTTGITHINLSANTNLWNLYAQGNSFEILDLSNNPLTKLYLSDNTELKSLDLRNGNNQNLDFFRVWNTPNLNCINADADLSQAMINSGKIFSEDCGDFIYIPDPNFEQALIDIGIDSDGVVNTSVLKADVEIVTILNLNNPANNQELPNVNGKIQDLTGIEAFSNLTNLSISFNEIQQLDISENKKLKGLLSADNKFSTVDLGSNPDLQVLLLNGKAVESIDLSNNQDLRLMQIVNTSLSEIDLSNNPNLDWVNLYDNQLTSIDLSKNTVVSQVWISGNKLESIVLPESENLKTVNLNDNFLTEIDLKGNSNLTSIKLANNNLFSLNVQNGNNAIIEYLITNGNQDLNCIQTDPGIVENVPAGWVKDSHAIYTRDCATKPEYVFIPDVNFEQSLIDLEIDDDGVVNTWMLKNDAEVVIDLNLNNPNFDNSDFSNSALGDIPGKITDLTGIEAFVNLKFLQAANALLTEVDLSANTQLEELFLNDNQLNSIDVSMLANLKRFGIMRNNMTSGIDVSRNSALEELFVHSTGINSLDLSANTALKKLSVYENQLSTLDISMLSVIDRVEAQYNANMTLITGANGNPTLTSLNLSGTGLSNFNGAAYPNLEWLLLNNNSLSNFNGNNNLNLQNLFLNNNAITKMGLTGNTQLIQLQVMNNGMEELDLRNGNNGILSKMKATGNILTCISVDDPADATMPYATWEVDPGIIFSLNCKQAEEVVIIPDPAFERALIDLEIDNNGLTGNILLSEAEAVTALNVSGSEITDATGIEAFVNLTDLDISDNLLTEINLLENSGIVSLDVSGNGLTELYISSGKNLMNLQAENNDLEQLNIAELTGLQNLDVSGNLFNSIILNDLSNLLSVDVSDNKLSKLDLRNGNNSAMEVMNTSNNPLLKCIGVDDESNIPAGWDKDADVNYTNSGDCDASIVLTKNVTVYLDRYGFAEITPADIDNGSYDNVTEQKNLIFELSTTQFGCDNLGDNGVYLFVTDESGNVGENNEPVIVTVVDELAPEVSAVRSISLNLNGGATIGLNAIDLDDGSTDNCSIFEYAVDQSSFSFPGDYSVEFSVSDASGNSSSTMVDVEVVDSQSNPTSLKFKGNIVAIVYPNPFTEYFKIGFSEPVDMSTVSAMVFDMGGGDTGLQFSVSGNELISDGNLSQQATYVLHVTLNGQTRSAEIRQD